MHVKLPKHPPSSLCGMVAAKLPAIDHLVHIKREEKKKWKLLITKALLLLLESEFKKEKV